MFIFIFMIDFPSFASVLVVYLYVCDLHSKFATISSSHFMPSINFPLFTKTLPWRIILASRDIFTKCLEAEVFGYDESL